MRRGGIERVLAAAERPSREGVANHGEMPVEDRGAFRTVETEGGEGRRRAAGAEPQFETAAGDEIEHRRVFGDADRIFERQRHDPGP